MQQDIYKVWDIADLIKGNSYVGRGIVIGRSADGSKAVAAYFIMGRSANSRNRIFTVREGEVFTEPFDASKVQDPNLIMYAAIRSRGSHLIVTNGNQTDTIYDTLSGGRSFIDALKTRTFEPDAPNHTPRISGMLNFGEGDFDYEMSILKSADAQGSGCCRQFFAYPALPGLGHFLHTYVCDGDPLPSFQGEPERVSIPDDIDAFADALWEALDKDNKISLYVRYIDLAGGGSKERVINKNA
jgi:IMP cyclohydrolase